MPLHTHTFGPDDGLPLLARHGVTGIDAAHRAHPERTAELVAQVRRFPGR